MLTLTNMLEGLFREAFDGCFGAVLKETPNLLIPEITPSTQPQFGHYQCNSCLKIGKELKRNPREVAQEIVLYFTESKEHSLIEKIEIAGPGFLNITLRSATLAKQLEAVLSDPKLGAPPLREKKRIIVEFSSPNIAKELHVGHLRSTIIGDAIARLFTFLGYDVLRLNHIGDWGTQFGMLIAYLKKKVPAFFLGKERGTLAQLMESYRAAKKLFDEEAEFKKQSQLEVVKLQGGDESSLEAWGMICDISREAFLEIYSLLDVQLEERGESFYNPFLAEVVSDLERKGLLVESDGARCLFLDGFTTREGEPLPMIVQKSDGGYNYSTTDMAAMRHRIEVEQADRIIVVTDGGQALHFQMIEKGCIVAGYLDPKKTEFNHVPFGVVLGPDGKKFKTRSGETEKLIDLIDQAISKASEIFAERMPDASPEEIKEYGKILGVDAIKYADLSSHRVKDYLFSYDRMLRFEGNTAAFLLYAFVRIEGIKKKVGKKVSALIGKASLSLEEPAEIALALHLRRFGEVLEAMAKDLLPNRLCEYLYSLAELFNAFFRDCRVEGSEEEESRLLLCELTSRILRQGLEILGLKTLPRM